MTTPSTHRGGRPRADVRSRLLQLGWSLGDYGTLRRGLVSWGAMDHGDSSVTRYASDERAVPEFTVQFSDAVPAVVIVAACEAAAKGERRA